ncbi:MAG: YihY/virulence factor BrkB family protein [Candidatus Latescibacteria bacterium]|nr:YihY/virulence factor BrkB family protein [Candidatus Latescibacterota bacterium]
MADLQKNITGIIKETFSEWRQQKPELIGAAIAFYVIFSLGPILVITIRIVGIIFGEKAAEGQIVLQIQHIVGQQPAEIIESIIELAYSPPSSYFVTIFSFPLVLIGATMIFFQIRNALHLIWGIEHSTEKGVIRLLKNYLFSFSLVIFMGIMVILLIVKSSSFAVLSELLSDFIPFHGYILQILDMIMSFLIITLLFTMIYKLLPDLKIYWSDVIVGASVTTLLLSVAQIILRLYIGHVDIGSAYGAIGSFTVLFVWVFYSSVVFLLGAVFTKVYAHKFGSFSNLMD